MFIPSKDKTNMIFGRGFKFEKSKSSAFQRLQQSKVGQSRADSYSATNFLVVNENIVEAIFRSQLFAAFM